MCGIVGTSYSKRVREYLLEGLKTLEYRGYDSAGIYLSNDKGSTLYKTTNRVYSLELLISDGGPGYGIGHTRWATHGEVSERNAHPQVSSDKRVYVVHNGVISNYQKLKAKLVSKGYSFTSETDTEVIANLFSHYLNTEDGLTALEKVTKELEGQWAFLVVLKDEPHKVYYSKNGSPLLIGRNESELYFSSDTATFIEYSSEVSYLVDGEYGYAYKGELVNFNNGTPTPKVFEPLLKESKRVDSMSYESYMLKEIDEEPERLIDLVESLDESLNREICDLVLSKNIIIVGSGTSYNAGLYSATFFPKEVKTKIASELAYEEQRYENTLFIMLSQSGETYDLIKCLPLIRECATNKILVLTNNPRSTLGRAGDYSIDLKALEEVAVASTKVYLSEVVTLYALAKKSVMKEYHDAICKVIESLKVVRESKSEIEEIANRYRDVKNSYFIGRSRDYALALEMSLKLKEVSYVHSEATYGGELKHGPIALIDSDFLSIFVVTDTKYKNQMANNIEEVKARKGLVLVLSSVGEFSGVKTIRTDIKGELSGLPLVMWSQYFSYYMAKVRGTNVDKPKNLAKSVTVE